MVKDLYPELFLPLQLKKNKKTTHVGHALMTLLRGLGMPNNRYAASSRGFLYGLHNYGIRVSTNKAKSAWSASASNTVGNSFSFRNHHI